MTVDRDEWRAIELARLDDLESSALQLEAATGHSRARLLARIESVRRGLLGTAEPLRVAVQVPAGASAAERRRAVVEAVSTAVAARDDEPLFIDPLEES